MIGFAVQERCPYCCVELDILAVEPGHTVLHRRRCTSRQCRKERRGVLVFQIRDGVVRLLTDKERSAMVDMQRGQAAKSLAS